MYAYGRARTHSPKHRHMGKLQLLLRQDDSRCWQTDQETQTMTMFLVAICNFTVRLKFRSGKESLQNSTVSLVLEASKETGTRSWATTRL